MGQYNITLQEGIDLTTAWRTANPNKAKAFKIDKAEMTQIFSDPNAVAVRAYLGTETSGKDTLVLVGVDSAGKDILTAIYDHVKTCPAECDYSSALDN